MDTYRENFLEAEMQAVDLVEQLEALKQEVSHYSTATNSLSEVRESILDLIEKQSDLTLNIKEVVDTLGKIGTTQIIDEIQSNEKLISKQIEDAGQSLNDLHQVTTAMREEVESLGESFEEKIGTLQKELRNISKYLAQNEKQQKIFQIILFIIGGMVLLFGLTSTIQLILIR